VPVLDGRERKKGKKGSRSPTREGGGRVCVASHAHREKILVFMKTRSARKGGKGEKKNSALYRPGARREKNRAALPLLSAKEERGWELEGVGPARLTISLFRPPKGGKRKKKEGAIRDFRSLGEDTPGCENPPPGRTSAMYSSNTQGKGGEGRNL